MRVTHYGGLGDFAVRDQSGFHFGSAEAMAGHIDHIINATGYPVISIFIAAATIAGEVHAFIGGEISLYETLVITIERPHLARPRLKNH